MISKIFRRKMKMTKKEETLPVQEMKKESPHPDKNIFLKYAPDDEAYVAPLKILLEQENMSYVDSVQRIRECFMVLNIITSHSLNVVNENVIEQAQKNGTRIINVIFDKNRQDTLDLIGESVWVEPQQINDYILSPLLYHAPYNKCFDKKKSEVLEQIKSILHGSVVPPRICIGADAIILFCGSFGYSMIREILEQKNYEINGKAYLLTKSKSVSYGQPEIGLATWCLEMDSVEEIDSLKERITDWINENVKEHNKLVIVAGLGKSTSSLVVPLLCSAARDMGIDTSVICVLPFTFESQNVQKLAKTSCNIIRSLCTTYVYDGSHEKGHQDNQGNIDFGEFQKLLQIGVMMSLRLATENKTDCKLEEHRIIIRQRGGECNDGQCMYGKYEVSVE